MIIPQILHSIPGAIHFYDSHIYISIFFQSNREQGHSNGQNQAAEKAEAKAREAKELAEEEALLFRCLSYLDRYVLPYLYW